MIRARLAVARAAVAIGLAPTGCHSPSATDSDCEAMVGRIVELELQERGFRDPALTDRKRNELLTSLQPELGQCRGMKLPDGAMACVAKARSTEELSDGCLR